MQKHFVRNPACALEAAVRSALDAHPEKGVWNWAPEALSVCRYTVSGAAHYKAVFPELDFACELEPAFLTLTLGRADTGKLVRRFTPLDFLRLQQLVDSSALAVTRDQLRSAIGRYNRVMSMPPWQRLKHRISRKWGRVLRWPDPHPVLTAPGEGGFLS